MLSETMCRRICQQKDEKEALHSPRTQGWSKSCKGRLQRRRMGTSRGWPKQHHHRHPHHHHRHLQRPKMSLRPLNVKGNRARGMQAPKNTNQFLMHEKYQMLHMHSDSVGSDVHAHSESDVELTDMDSYLCVLENARGALLDSPNPHGPSAPSPGPFLHLHPDSLHLHQDSLHLHQDSLHLHPDKLHLHQDKLHLQENILRLQEDSMPYFPSEDDLMQSQNFMQKDFVEFHELLMT
ncbi:uncharacterized protein LOC114463805 isoform X2 [Gouania willdenowi]|uniref:uncharacterized protein LOC114463805 isoform X2 n=1 Tax=Gouania willdenowi TaxID=441366 RepID=UPI001056060F|nr:uncharacterized protein LOC114463805 isoform X2 [Gouania willdenowi]